MDRLRRVCAVAAHNFRGWARNPRIYIAFALAFILCFLLSDKVVAFSREYCVTMQIAEAFVWTFGDAGSILLSSLLLVLLFADMPFLGAEVPFYLSRIDRKTWVFGQVLYIVLATCLYMIFVLAATTLLCMSNAFVGNMWSETAAILGYSDAGRAVALPVFVKVLEMTTSYQAMLTIFALMLLYALLLALIMLALNLVAGRAWGIAGAFGFSAFGALLNPQFIKSLLHLPDEMAYKANVAMGWLSPLNHATYAMHNFGYDLLPRLWQSFAVFALLIALCAGVSMRAARRYSFTFTGTEG